MTTDATPQLLKPRDVQKRLAVSDKTLRKLTNEGTIPCVRLGERTIRYRPQDVEEAIDRLAGRSSGDVAVE
jgi:excisionase family DNA binding protein